MSESGEPPRKIDLQPGEDMWTAMAREVATRPDSPASLKIISAVNSFMRRRSKAADQVVDALAALIEGGSSANAQAAVDAAIIHWERVCN